MTVKAPGVLAIVGDETGCSMCLPSSSALSIHVPHVVELCAEEKMARVTARRVVAMVADLHAIRNRTACQSVGHTMGVRPAHTIPNAAISAPMATCPRPRPAFVRAAFVDVGPEAGVQIGQRTGIAARARAKVAFRWAGWRALVCDATARANQADSLVGHWDHTPSACPRTLARRGGTFMSGLYRA